MDSERQASETVSIPPALHEGDWLITPWGHIVELPGQRNDPCDCGLCPDDG